MSSLGIYATATVIAISSSAAMPVVPLLAKRAAWVLTLIVIVCVLVEIPALMVAMGVIIPSALAKIHKPTINISSSAILKRWIRTTIVY